jgi:hypothetical protein
MTYRGDELAIGPLTKEAAAYVCDLLLELTGETVRRIIIGANIARTQSKPARFVIHRRDLEEARRVVLHGNRTE